MIQVFILFAIVLINGRESNVSAFAGINLASTRTARSTRESAIFAFKDDTAVSGLPKPTPGDKYGIKNRRAALKAISSLPLLWTLHANPSYAKGIKPDTAFNALLKAREELDGAGKMLSKRDYDGLREYLEGASNMNSYEANAGALLESKRLDAESKKDIGTIRRFGVGADVIIMYGGLRNEIETNDQPSYSELAKYLKRTMDSLDEVIAICRSNGFE